MPNDSPDRVELYRASGLSDAHLLRVALEAEGISASVENELLQGAVGELPGGWNTAPRVTVSRVDLSTAQFVLARHLKRASDSDPPHRRDSDCLACGTSMAEASVCPRCGWSYLADAKSLTDTTESNADPEELLDEPPEVTTGSNLAEPVVLATPLVWWEVAAVLAVGVVPHWFSVLFPAVPSPYWLDSTWLIASSGCTILVTMYLIRRSGQSWSYFGITRPHARDVVYGGVMYLVAETTWRLGYLFIPLTNEEVAEPDSSVATMVSDYPWMVARYLCSGFSEELVTRCYLIVRLRYLLQSPQRAVVVAAMLFSSYHTYQGGAGILLTFLLGLAYGSCYLVQGRIWPLALGHALFNMRLELLSG